MDSSKLRKHQEKFHAATINRDNEFYMNAKRLKLGNNEAEDNDPEPDHENEQLAKASLIVSQNVAKFAVSYQVGEGFFKKTMIDVTQALFPPDVSETLKKIPMSKQTIQRKIRLLSDLDESSLITELKASKHFALQLDESTDVCKNSVLVAFVRYGHEKVLKTELLFCKNISTTTTGKDVFDIISSFFDEHNLQWSQVCSVSTDGAPSMTGRRTSIRAFIQVVSFFELFFLVFFLKRFFLGE
jgi:hypothetical protein